MKPVQLLLRVTAAGAFLIWSTHSLGAQTPANSSAEISSELAASRARLAAETYVIPPAEIVKLVTAPRQQYALPGQQSPDRRHFLREVTDGMPSVTTFGKPHYYFAGLQVDRAANRARSLTNRGLAKLEVVDALSGQLRAIEIPAGATASGPVWSPDGSMVAFIANFPRASRAYVADIATGKSREVTPAGSALLATLVTSLDWTADGKSLLAVLIPDNRGPEPVAPEIATGPKVRLWADTLKSPQRNFASLLQVPFDQTLMEYYVTGQLAAIDVRTRTAHKIGAPAMLSNVEPSPDGKYFRITTMRKPFSYVVQYGSFGEVEEIWDSNGKVLAEVVKRPLRESADTSDTPGPRRSEGPKRSLGWMPTGEGLYYLEAAPAPRGNAGDSTAAPAPGGRGPGGSGTTNRPDRLVRWMPPFGPGDTTVLFRADGPVSQVAFSEDAKTVFLGVTRNGTGEIFAVRLSQPDHRYSIVRQRGYTPVFLGRGGFGAPGGGGPRGGVNDSLSFYTNPGSLMTRPGRGRSVVLISGDSAVYLSGVRYDRNYLESIPRGFVDRVTIASGAKTRVYEGPSDVSETFSAPLDDDLGSLLVVRESPTEVPNAYRRDLKSGVLTPITSNRDLTPEFTSLVRKRVVVTRADGIRFVVRLTLPAGYQAGTRLPGMFWLYPYEYTDQAGYDRTLRTENVKRFPASQPRTIEFLATQGYAVANFDPPIIGEQGRMNDNYVSDLRMNLYAVIDELDRQGFIDRTRLGIGGHSYGAFSTVNALVHTPFFKAGIAGDGMYNRTLTPTGFQSERRDLWSGQKTYLDMSPMLYADKLQGALLMYHNLEDQNVGTDPISSIRMMQALRSEGKTAALYLYPYEDHGPLTRETILDLWGRWTAWLDIYVKNAGKSPKTTVVSDGAAPKQP